MKSNESELKNASEPNVVSPVTPCAGCHQVLRVVIFMVIIDVMRLQPLVVYPAAELASAAITTERFGTRVAEAIVFAKIVLSPRVALDSK
nr:hypothetical protein [Pseudomonas aeruginosa]